MMYLKTQVGCTTPVSRPFQPGNLQVDENTGEGKCFAHQLRGHAFLMLQGTAHGFFTVGIEGSPAKIRSLAYSPAMIAEG
jgi:hypothetical protein